MKGMIFEYWIIGSLILVTILISYFIFSQPINTILDTFITLLTGNTTAVNILITLKSTWNLWVPIMVIGIMFLIFLVNFRKSEFEDYKGGY